MTLTKLSGFGTLGLIIATAAPAAFAKDDIIGGTTVSADSPIAATTVLIVGEVAASATTGASTSMSFVKKPTPTPAPSPGTGDPQTEQYICTGSIIADDIVVTAAHCVVADPANLRIVFATDITNLQQSQVATIDAYLANPNWVGDVNGQVNSGADAGDIALIHLSSPLPSGYHPATLLPVDTDLTSGEPTTLAGYGITSANPTAGDLDGAGTLRETQVQISQAYGQTEEVLDQSQGSGACSGDSGGPAFLADASGNLYLWGATSRGTADCTTMIYTRIQTYADWISQAEAQLRAGQ